MSKRKSQFTIYESAARTATPLSEIFPSQDFLGLSIVIDVTALSLTPSVVPAIQVQDKLSGKFITILTGAAITSTGVTRMRVFPGMAAVTNVSADDFLLSKFKIVMTHGDTDSITYSVGCELVG